MNIGQITFYGSEVIPEGWLICDGSAVSREAYSKLFLTIGTTFGAGDGQTTFNLPNLQGRVPVGKSNETEFNELGKIGGEKTHTLSVNEMPKHNHTTSPTLYETNFNYSGGANIDVSCYDYSGLGAISYNEAGNDQPHNNLQPYQVGVWIIKALDIVPSSKKISELPTSLGIDDNDVLPIVQNEETKKISFGTIMNAIYPVGSIIIKDDNTDYSNWLGFTWEKVFNGRVLVGQDTTQTEFDTIGETGGSKALQEHKHYISRYIDQDGFAIPYQTPVIGWGLKIGTASGQNDIQTTNTGTGNSGNLQPYQVVAYWKRTE